MAVPQGTTYLELSEPGNGAHKYYEVTVTGTLVSIRYGRIGASGQVQSASFPTAQKAEAAAAKKVAEKVRKGYAAAVPGRRAARTVTRRAVQSAASTAQTGAPTLWRFHTGGSNAFGIHVGADRCWVGNQNGDVYALSHGGEVEAHYRLPDGVKCLVADDFWIYAGCDDGSVYDLSAKIPHAAYQIAADVDIFWLNVRIAKHSQPPNPPNRAFPEKMFILTRSVATGWERAGNATRSRAARHPGPRRPRTAAAARPRPACASPESGARTRPPSPCPRARSGRRPSRPGRPPPAATCSARAGTRAA